MKDGDMPEELNVAMVKNYNRNPDGTMDRFDIEEDILGGKYMHMNKKDRSVFSKKILYIQWRFQSMGIKHHK